MHWWAPLLLRLIQGFGEDYWQIWITRGKCSKMVPTQIFDSNFSPSRKKVRQLRLKIFKFSPVNYYSRLVLEERNWCKKIRFRWFRLRILETDVSGPPPSYFWESDERGSRTWGCIFSSSYYYFFNSFSFYNNNSSGW